MRTIKLMSDRALNDLLQQICELDIDTLDTLGASEADAYVWASSHDFEDGLEVGIKLAEKSRKFDKPIYQVWCKLNERDYAGFFFVSEKKDITALLKATLAEIEKELGNQDG
jgi:hypothetical protein